MEQKKKTKTVIIVLAVLLVLSLSALGGTLVYNKLTNAIPATAAVPNNLITPDEKNSNSDRSNVENSVVTGGGTASVTARSIRNSDENKKAATIELYNKQPEESTPFRVGNMFPGDTETKYFRVRATYHDSIIVHYKATVRPGYEKMAEVLKVRIKLLTTGETMYDGLIKNMPESVMHQLTSKKSVTDELHYEVTAYLDTSVGNEYQNKDLIADFKWWVEEIENLDNSPKTGDTSNIMVWAVLAAFSGCVFIFLLLVRRRKEDEENV